jgi:hypothetical protein
LNPNFRIENAIYLGGGKYFTPGLPDDKNPKDGNIHTAARIIQLLDKLKKQEGKTDKPELGPNVGYAVIPQ